MESGILGKECINLKTMVVESKQNGEKFKVKVQGCWRSWLVQKDCSRATFRAQEHALGSEG